MAEEKTRVSQQEKLIERQRTRKNGLLKVADLFFNGGVEKAKQAQNDRIEEIKKKIAKLKERNFSELISKLKLTNEGRAIDVLANENKQALIQVEETLQNLASNLNASIEFSEVNVVERELKKIEALIKRLNKAKELTTAPEITQQIDELKTKKVIYLVGELYKIDTKSLNDPNIKGRQLYLIQQITSIQTENPGLTLEQLIQKKLLKDTLEAELSDFVKEYLKSKRESENIQPEGIARQKLEISKEKKRYRRSAQLHALFEKIASIDFTKAEEKYSAADLEKFVRRLREQYDELQASSDEHISAIKTDLETEKEKIMATISQLENILNRFKTELKDVTNLAERKAKLQQAYSEIQQKLIPVGTEDKPYISEFLDKTDYEAQVGKRIELAQKDTERMEFLKKFEDFSEAHMREYEQMRRTEREGPIEKKAAMARSFIKTRIMEEFGDTEKVRTLYGNSYRKMWVEGSKNPSLVNNEYNTEFKNQLMLETAEMFGLDTQSIEEKSKQPGFDIQKEQELVAKLNNEINRLISTQEKSTEFVWKYEKEKDKQAEIDQAIKADLIAARKASEPGIDGAQVNAQIERLFTDEKTGGKIKPFELIPTPNGVAIVFEPDKIEDIKKFIFGENSQYAHPETMAFTLKNNEALKRLVAKELSDPEWNGNLMVITSDSDEYTMMHEAQHAINKHLSNEILQNNPEAKELNGAAEEIATRFSSGEVWRELAFPQDEKTSKINLSLLGLGYITSDTKIPQTELANLYNFVERAKDLVREEIKIFNVNNESPIDQNMYGEIVAEILMSNIGEDGKFDIQAAYKELTTRFEDIFKKLSAYQDKTTLEPVDIYGIKLEPTEQETLKQNYDWLRDNEGFTFDLVGLKDIRGRANIVKDYYMDDKHGIERVAKGVSTTGSVLLDIPIIGTTLGEGFAKSKGQHTGTTEYEVSDFWIPFLNKRNYKTRNRAFGGIWRKFKNIPFIGDSNEKMTKFGTSPAKFLNDLPPFGRGWEMIMKDLLATKRGKKVKDWLETTFPGRDMNPIETTKMNASEIWKLMIEQGNADLGEAGLGLSHEQILRILAEHPMLVVEYSSGQIKQEYSQANLDRKNELGIHRGAITDDVLKSILDEDLDNAGSNQFKPKDGRKYKEIKKEAIDLAEAIKEWYHPDDNPYTVNDLIHAAHLCHDLGIHGLNPKIIRNDYYAKHDKDDPDFHQDGNKMVSKYIWYSLENPDIRGVVIDDQYFSLESAHELLRRYNYSFIKDTLKKELPEITPEMQYQNKFDFDVKKENKIKSVSDHEIHIPESEIKKILDLRNGGRDPVMKSIAGVGDVPISDIKQLIYYYYSDGSYIDPAGTPAIPAIPGSPMNPAGIPAVPATGTGASIDWINNEHFAISINHHGDYELFNIKKGRNTEGHEVARKNIYHNPSALLSPYRNMIGGFEGSERIAKKYLDKTLAEFDGGIDAIEKGLKYSNEFVRRIAEVSQYERMAYYRKTFWGDTKLWIQRLGNVAMLGSLVAAGLTGAPVFASIILGTMAVRIPLVMWMSKIEATYGDRRKGALGLQGELSGMIGNYKEIMGKPIGRLDEWMFDVMQNNNESKVEDLAKQGTPEGTYPGGDLAFKFANTIFGEKGLVGRMAGG